MKKLALGCALVCLLAGVWAGQVAANQQVSEPSTMAVAPNTLQLSKVQANVTVHTAIPYGAVDTATLEMNGLRPLAVGWDTCGDLVAKFSEGEVKALAVVAPPEATLTMTGVLVNGEPLSLTGTVQVKP
jgi:hypothetical protein